MALVIIVARTDAAHQPHAHLRTAAFRASNDDAALARKRHKDRRRSLGCCAGFGSH